MKIRTKVYAVISFPAVFMGAPALSVFITRKLTQDTTPLNFSTKFSRIRKRYYFLRCFRARLSL